MFMEGARAVTDIDRLAEGYKGAIDEIRGLIANTGFSGGGNPNFWAQIKEHFLVETRFYPRPAKVVQRKIYPFPK